MYREEVAVLDLDGADVQIREQNRRTWVATSWQNWVQRERRGFRVESLAIAL